MRKTLHITMAIALLVSTMGFSVTQHYCCGEFVGATLLGTPDTCCDGQTIMPPKCCHNETEFHQLDDDFAGTTFAIPTHPVIYAPLPVTNSPSPVYVDAGQSEYLNYKPPLILHLDICIRVQSFLI